MAKQAQTEMRFRTWGGKRKGAGRPAKSTRPSEPHQKRARVRPGEPVHVVLRVEADVGSMRRRDMYRALREATITVARRDDVRIIHVSIQGTHVHLIVEARGRMALARGMQAFQISAAKHVNAAITKRTGTRRRGRVFCDRYHARSLRTPRQVRNALAYVLNNWRHHGEDRGRRTKAWKVDPFSTGWSFDGWKERAAAVGTFQPPPGYEALVVWRARSWLLREGWRRHGRVSVFEVPG